MTRYMLMTLFLLLCSPVIAVAQPEEIDVVGMIPGVSTKAEVENQFTSLHKFSDDVGQDHDLYTKNIAHFYYLTMLSDISGSDNENLFGKAVIGGFELVCLAEFIDDLLARLYCDKQYGMDTISNSKEPVTAYKINTTLAKGYQKKFGKPQRGDTETFHWATDDYVTYAIMWRDRVGNELLLRREHTFDEPMRDFLELRSKKYIDLEKHHVKEQEDATKGLSDREKKIRARQRRNLRKF